MSSFSFRKPTLVIFPTFLILIITIVAVAQSQSPTPTPQPSQSPSPAGSIQSPNTAASGAGSDSPAVGTATSILVTPSDDVPPVNPAVARIERARALAAAHQLPQAAIELENIRASVRDVAIRNVTTIMLIGIYLEEGNYVRSQALLEEAFVGRMAQQDESLRTYFAAAGQTINSVRNHLARYRAFGIDPTAAQLPVEANTDLERVRGLLERVVAQAKEIGSDAGRSYDAVALLEDVVGVRLSLARNSEDRDKWQAEYTAVREKIASSKVQVTSIGRAAALDAVTARIPNPFATESRARAGAGETKGDSTKPADVSSSAGQPSSGPAGNSSAQGPEPKLISTGSLSGRETKRVTPTYPAIAKTTGVSGTVRVFAIVDENGKVWVTNSEGPTLLRKAAEDAARNWTFPPTLVGGKPVRVAGYLDFDFKL